MDEEIYIQLLRQIIKPNDEVTVVDQKLDGIFIGHPNIWYGRLSNPGCSPGLYLDRNLSIIKVDNKDLIVKTANLAFKNQSILEERINKLLGNWNEIDFSKDFLNSKLPETPFFEGDVVLLIDEKHPNFNSQYTVYRIYYDNIISGASPHYRLRAGKVQFDVNEDQIRFLAEGPIRIFYSADAFKLNWKSLKDEAEFYLLLGRFKRLFNTKEFSYKWTLEDAKSSIQNQLGDGILKQGDGFAVVNFSDKEIGDQVKCNPDLILDI